MKTISDDFLTLLGSLTAQRRFSDRVYDQTDDPAEKARRMRSLIMGLQAETIDLLSTVRYKDHVNTSENIDTDKILFEAVDIYRYLLAILNNWDISPRDFAIACATRDKHLHGRKDLEQRPWNGSDPVVVFDLDDVLGSFRSRFFDWIRNRYKIDLDHDNDQYYCTSEMSEAGLNPESVYEKFIHERQVLSLPVIKSAARCVQLAKEMGCYVQILTARPGDNSLLCYNTYEWLQEAGLLQFVDDIAFSGEKMRWVMKQPWYNENKLVCAFEDSPKHAGEYASHGVKVLAPMTSYNKVLLDKKNVVCYKQGSVKEAENAFADTISQYRDAE